MSALFLVALPFLFQNIAIGQDASTRRILILNEVGPTYPIIKLIDQGIQNGLDHSPYKLEFDYEHMDVTLFPDQADQRRFRNFYIRKYRNHVPDLIITVGPHPLAFMQDAHKRFFPHVPVVFCIPNGLVPGSPGLNSDFTGVETDFAAGETLSAALRLVPGTEHVVVVGGVAAYDRQREAIVKEQLRSYAQHLDISYATDLAMPVLLEHLKHLPKHTVVLMTAIGQDAAGTHFNSSETGTMISSAANSPVFSLSDLYLDHGEVGGDLADLSHQGKIAADLALRILRGEKPQDIPHVRGVDTYEFDWRAMQKWGLKETNLPAGSVLINRRLSFWQLYRRYALTALFLFLAQALAIVALLWQRTNRRRIQAELIWRLELESLLAELSTLFIDLPEEEIEKNIECGLVRLGQFLRFDRISLLEFSPDRKALRTLCSWNSPEIAPAPAVLNTEQVGWCTQQLLRGEICLISDLKAIPKEACAEKGYYHQNGVASGASVPLKLGGEINGVITFVAARRPVLWTDTLITQLRTIGEIFWNALQRKHTMEALSLSRATLRESEERFRLVANTAPVLIWMSGTDTLRTYFNQPWLEFTGRPIHEELGDGWTASIHPEDLETCLGTYSKSFHQRAPFQMSYRLARHDGEYRWLLDHGVPRFNTDGSFAGYIGSVIDVTERKEAETVLSTVSRKLIEAHEEERTWIARELHDDFIQRISLLAVNLDRLTKEIPIAKAEMRHSMEEACERVSSLASDIQALSHRLHSSKLEYLGLVAACRGVCRELSDQQGVEIDFCAADVPKTLPEEVSLCLFRVLQEALQNAAKHSGSRQFKVWIKCEESEIELSVHDSGTGFDPASAFKGRGLGLISMGERVKLVDGQLFIESIPQHGTTILARVPISPKPLSKEARAQISAIGMQNALLNKPFAKPPNLCAGSASIKG